MDDKNWSYPDWNTIGQISLQNCIQHMYSYLIFCPIVWHWYMSNAGMHSQSEVENKMGVNTQLSSLLFSVCQGQIFISQALQLVMAIKVRDAVENLFNIS